MISAVPWSWMYFEPLNSSPIVSVGARVNDYAALGVQRWCDQRQLGPAIALLRDEHAAMVAGDKFPGLGDFHDQPRISQALNLSISVLTVPRAIAMTPASSR